MFDRTSHFAGDESRLADLARRDAERATPAFSHTLHTRIIRAVDRADLAASRLSHSPRRSTVRYWIAPLAMAATVALVAVPTALLRVGPGEPVAIRENRPIAPPAPVNSEPPVAAIEGAVHRANVRAQDLVQTAMAEQQFAGLDHDVRTATRYLVDQVPFRSAWESDESGQPR